MNNTSNFKIKKFNDLKLSDENVYSQIEKYCNRIEILQNPVVYEEQAIMRVAEVRDKKRLLEKLDYKIYQRKIEREELSRIKKIAGSVKKIQPYKISNLEMYNNESLNKMINSIKNVKSKVLPDYAKKKKEEEKQPMKEKVLSPSRSSNKVDASSNFQVLNMILAERKEKNFRVSVDDAFFNKEIYKQVKRSTLSHNAQDFNKLSNMWKEENFRTPIKKMQTVNQEDEIETDPSFRIDSIQKQHVKKVSERRKIRKLCSDIKQMKPNGGLNLEATPYSSTSPFKRKSVYLDELTIQQMNKGMKHRSLSNVKPLYMSPTKKVKEINEFSTEAGKKKKTIFQKCNKIITSQTDLLKNKTKQIEENNKKYEEKKLKLKYGVDNPMICELKKESGKYNEQTGVFLYSNKGHKMNNYQRLYSKKYKVN